MPVYHLASFSSDATPGLGHPLCGGWIEPARGVDDPLLALGVVLLGVGQPIVLCAVDWVAIRNDAHQAWQVADATARFAARGANAGVVLAPVADGSSPVHTFLEERLRARRSCLRAPEPAV